MIDFVFSSRRRHTRCALVTGVQTCALPIWRESGRTFHAYFHPERDMPAEAEAVHGLSVQFLSDKPLFASRVDELLEFLGDAPMVAHNPAFDFGFINAELARAGRPARKGVV